MKSTLKLSSLLLLMFLGIATFSCSDDGKDGEDGLDGAPGTANVFYSEWLSTPVGQAAVVDATSGMLYTYAAPQITSDILSSGAVLTYLQFSTEVMQLPYTSQAGGTTNTVAAMTTVGNLKVFRYRHDGGTPTIPLGAAVRIRYIVIPGGFAARQSDLRNKSYEEVCALFGIPE